MYYQAALTFQRFLRRDQSKKETKLATLRSKKLKPLQELDEDQALKIQSAFETTKTFVDKQAYDKLITNFQENLKLKRTPKKQLQLGDLKSVSGCPSPYLKTPQPEKVNSSPILQDEPKYVFSFPEGESPANLAKPKVEVMQSIEDFPAIGFYQPTNLDSESSSISKEETSP
jgi:hypothetical protein